MSTVTVLSSSWLRSGLAAAVAFPLLGACGGGAQPPANTPTTTTTANEATQALSPAGSAGSKKAERRTNPGWSTCHAGYKMSGADFAAEVSKLAQGCATQTKMHAIGDTSKGSQSAASPPQKFNFKAKANHCYRAYAAAASTIKDLDLLIKDSTDAVAGEDSTDDPTPVVLEDGAVCFKEDDDATVVVSVGDGNGAYAVQVWGDE